MSPSTLEGTTVGKYRLLEALGRGGMAQVYKAYHPQLDRHVAIKILRSDLVEEKEFLARCIRCGECAKACPVDAIYLDITVEPFVCIHCSRCVKYCPHDCLEMKEVVTEDEAAEKEEEVQS